MHDGIRLVALSLLAIYAFELKLPIMLKLCSINHIMLPIIICDLPRENRPSSHLVMIVEIPVLKFLIGVTSFCSCQADYLW